MGSLSVPEHLLGDVVVSEERIQSTVKRITKEIYYGRDYVDQVPVLLCVKNGAIPFFDDLCRELSLLSFSYDSTEIDAHSYDLGLSSGKVDISLSSESDLKNRLVIIVEDIIDTSETMVRICEYLDNEQVVQRNVCTLLFKERPENIEWRKAGLYGYGNLPEVRHVGVFIDPLFVVGYGLDYRQYGRDGKEVRVLTPKGQAWIDSQIEEKSN